MNKKLFLSVSAVIPAFIPVIASAQTRTTLATLIDQIIGYANILLVLMMGIAVVMFVFYIIKYFIRADANRAEAGTYVMYSLIGFFIILSFWGLVNILQNTFGLKNETNRPSGWTSFTNIFPGGGSGSRNSSPVYDRSLSNPGGSPTYDRSLSNPPAYDPAKGYYDGNGLKL